MTSHPTAWPLLLVVLLSVAGCSGCFRRSTTPPPTTTTTTTTRAPVLEDTISAGSAGTVDRTNAWESGGGIDWTQVGPSGQSNPNRGSSTSSGGSRRGSSSSGGSSPSSGSSSSFRGPAPSSPQSVSRGELRLLSEELLSLDTNAVGSMITLNQQGRTSSSGSNDQAPEALFSKLPPSAFSGPTIAALWALLDNYNPRVTLAETDTPQELEEQSIFLDAVMRTQIMTRTEEFLRGKGLITRPLREVLKEIWFTPYTRSRQTIGSSGFEHVFVGEIKGTKISGFHNWISFYKEEQEGDLDYFGYMKVVDLGSKADIIMLKFNWDGDVKPVGSMFVGTSPEFDMALYTICFYARPGNNCPIQLNGFRMSIKTYYLNYHGKKYVGTAFPNI